MGFEDYDIKPDDILQATNGGLDIILSYYKDAEECVDNKNKRFKIREERTPSASLKKLSDGNYVVTDFGADAKPMNAISVCVKEEGVKYRQALEMLADRYGISRTNKTYNNYARYTSRPATEEETEGWYEIEYNDSFSDFEMKVLGPAVTKEVLNYYNYKSVARYRYVQRNKEGVLKFYEIEATDTYPIFCLDEGEWQKMYQPLNVDKSYRFRFFGKKEEKNFIVGLRQLEKKYEKHIALQEGEETDEVTKLPMVIIGSGDRDSLNLAGQGYDVVWLNSETANLMPAMYWSIAKCVEKIYICPDIDDTGIRAAYALADKFLYIYIIQLPEFLSKYKDWRGRPRKDYRDYVELFPSRYDTQKLIDVAMPFKFWQENVNKKTGEVKYAIDESRLLFFLEAHGFGQVSDSFNREGTTYVRNIDNRVTEYPKTVNVRAFIQKFVVDNFLPNKLKNTLLRAQLDNVFSGLKTLNLDFADYTPTSQYLFFENKSVLVSATEIKEMAPKEVKFPVWSDKVIKHQFKKIPPIFEITEVNGEMDITINNGNCNMLNYLINASRVYWREELEQRLDQRPEEEREAYRKAHKFDLCGSLLSDSEKAIQKKHLINKIFAIGYLLHSYKDPEKAWAVYATDNLVSIDGESHGRSGKSLCLSSLSKLKKVCFMSGKDKEANKNAHLFDRVSKQTDLIFVDDRDKYQEFDIFYDKLTSNMVINPKGLKTVEIDKKDSPKFMFTSNFPIKDTKGSSNGRLLYMLFSDYYHVHASDDYRETRSVADDLGKVIFDDNSPSYTQEEWNTDYNFFVQCLQFYLSSSHKKIDPPAQELTQRKYIEIMGLNFLDWADEYFSCESERLNTELVKIDVMRACKEYVQLSSPQSFKTKLAAYCSMRGYVLNPPSLCDKNGRILRSAGEMIYISTKSELNPVELTMDRQLKLSEDDKPF